MTVPPNPTLPIIGKTGLMATFFQSWTQAVSRLFVLTGTGSPEGVVEALPTRVYMDITGTAGNIQYIKRDADIGGDKTQGWILV